MMDLQTPKVFSLEIEKIAKEKDITHMDAVLLYCKDNQIEPEKVSSLITKGLKEKIERKCKRFKLFTKTCEVTNMSEYLAIVIKMVVVFLLLILLTFCIGSAYAKTIKIGVEGMVCDFCAQSIQKVFLKQPGVEKVDVNLEVGKVTVKMMMYFKMMKMVYLMKGLNNYF